MYTENHDNNEVVYAGSAGDDMPSDARVKESFDLELVKVGLPSYVDHYSRGVQRHPQVVADNGTFIVAWTDDVLPQCEIGGPDIRAKKLASDASDLGEAAKVNTETIDHQRDPSLAVLTDGKVIIAWQDFSGRGGDPCSGAIKAQVFDPHGIKIGAEFLVNSTTEGRQSKVTLAPHSNGGFVATWLCESRGNLFVRAQSFDEHADRVGDEITVCSRAAPVRAKICALPDEGFAVLYKELAHTHGSPRGSTRLFVRHSEKGHLVETDILLSADASATGPLGLADLANGSLIAIWIESTGHKNIGSLMASIVDADGVFGEPIVVAEACDVRAQMSLARSGGNLLLLATAETVGELKTIRIIAFDTARGITRSDTVLHRTHAHSAFPAIATLPDNDHMVVWEVGETIGQEDWIWIKAQRFRYK
ncbi:calcium-binding protein [Pseudorhizobium halotolerans]|uniref:Calcium-binding protein n=1 Tax=Pseudorhizobium halotolerans TaxID=1233081 RepID=A0ABN7K1T5_9HYPH|nr:hypothetical protein [Pseudorhizobium halotolerans]CAD7054399.1 calcium-binding protein [Pseudorhizobium halotolerans]